MSSIFLPHRNVGIGCCNKCCQCPTHIFQHCLHAYSFCPVLNSLPEDLSTHTEAGHKYWGVTAPGNYPQSMMKGNWLMNSPVSSPLMTEVEGSLQIWSWSKQPQCHLGAHWIRNSEGSAQTVLGIPPGDSDMCHSLRTASLPCLSEVPSRHINTSGFGFFSFSFSLSCWCFLGLSPK